MSDSKDKPSSTSGPKVIYGVDKVRGDLPTPLADIIFALDDGTKTTPESVPEKIEEPRLTVTLLDLKEEPWLKVQQEDGAMKKIVIPEPADPTQKSAVQYFNSLICTQASAMHDQEHTIRSQKDIIEDQTLILEKTRKERNREIAEAYDAIAVYRNRLLKCGMDVELPNVLSRAAYRASKWEDLEDTRRVVEEAEQEEQRNDEADAENDEDDKLVQADVDSTPEFEKSMQAAGKKKKSRKTEVIGYPPVRFSNVLSPIGEEPSSDELKRGSSTGVRISEVTSPSKMPSKQSLEFGSPKMKPWKIYKKDNRIIPDPPEDIEEVFAKEKEKLRQVKRDARKSLSPLKMPVSTTSTEQKTGVVPPSVPDDRYIVEVGGRYIDMLKPPVNLSPKEMEILLDRLRIVQEKDIIEKQLTYIVQRLENLGVEEEHVNNLLKYGTKIPLKSKEEIEKKYAKEILQNFPEQTKKADRIVQEVQSKYDSVVSELVELKKTINQSKLEDTRTKKRYSSDSSSSTDVSDDSDIEERRRTFNPFRKDAEISKILRRTAGGNGDPDDDDDRKKRDRKRRESDDKPKKNGTGRRDEDDSRRTPRRDSDRDNRRDGRQPPKRDPDDDDGDDSDPSDSESDSDTSQYSKKSDTRSRRTKRDRTLAKSVGNRSYELKMYDVSGNPMQPIHVHIPQDVTQGGRPGFGGSGTGVYTTRAMDLTKVERYQGPEDSRSPAAFIREFEYYTSTCKDDKERARYFINRMDFKRFIGAKSYKEKWGYKKMKQIFLKNEWNATSRLNLIQKLDHMKFDSKKYQDFLSFITDIYCGLNDCELDSSQIYPIIIRKCPPQYSMALKKKHFVSFHKFNQKIRELHGIYGSVEKQNVLPVINGARLAILDSGSSKASTSKAENAESTEKKKFIPYNFKKTENTFQIAQSEPENDNGDSSEGEDSHREGVIITDLGYEDFKASGNE